MTDVLDELKWRGLMALSTDEEALRAHLDAGPVTFYVGFDPTAPSLHFGNLVQLIVARHLQQAGHRPLHAGRRLDRDDRGSQGVRRAGAEHQGDGGRLGAADPPPGRALCRLQRAGRGADREQPRLDRPDAGAGLPARHRQALPDQPDAGPRRGPEPAGGGHLLHRVLLRAAAVAGLPRAVPQLRVHAAVRRQRPVGQHHRRGRADPAGRGGPGARPGHTAADQGRRHEVRQDRDRHDLARPAS